MCALHSESDKVFYHAYLLIITYKYITKSLILLTKSGIATTLAVFRDTTLGQTYVTCPN